MYQGVLEIRQNSAFATELPPSLVPEPSCNLSFEETKCYVLVRGLIYQPQMLLLSLSNVNFGMGLL